MMEGLLRIPSAPEKQDLESGKNVCTQQEVWRKLQPEKVDKEWPSPDTTKETVPMLKA